MHRSSRILFSAWFTSAGFHALVIGGLASLSVSVFAPTIQLRPGGGPISVVVELAQAPTERVDETWHVHVSEIESDHTHEPIVDTNVSHVRLQHQVPFEAAQASLERAELATPTALPKRREMSAAAAASPPPNVRVLRHDRPTDSREPLQVTPPIPRHQVEPQIELAQVEMPDLVTSERSGQVDNLPKKRRGNPAPPYPTDAYAQGIQGAVFLNVTVTSEGRVSAISVAESSGFSSLDRSALETVRTWQFDPARQGGVAVDYTIRVPIRFSIRGR